MSITYVSKNTAQLYIEPTGTKKWLDLLWGDRVTVLEEGEPRSKVQARGKTGYVSSSALHGESLLEVYFIDVGQGDGVLIRTPDDKHIIIDGGSKRSSQPTGKNAADFTDWKFARDYGQDRIHLDAMIVTHCDADHYGGLWDLLNVSEIMELDARDVRVDAFYHAGIAWWINPASGKRWLGLTSPDKKYLTQLMGNRTEVAAALKDDADPRLQGEWAKFMKCVTETRTIDGSETPVNRLSHLCEYMPGFDGSDGGVAIRVLSPFETEIDGQHLLHNFSTDDSINTNGNSLMVRLDYKSSRILLTGDLNADSQKALLDDYAGRRTEFQCDVAKTCHHGSDEISYEFLCSLRPAVTVISSGDAEGYDHPRPGIVAASATTGYFEVSGDRIVSPLVYSTELARSIILGKPVALRISNPAGDTVIPQNELGKVGIDANVMKVGDLHPTMVTKNLAHTYIAAGLVYGLVNVRTDGKKILCATLNEKDNTWQIKEILSRF